MRRASALILQILFTQKDKAINQTRSQTKGMQKQKINK